MLHYFNPAHEAAVHNASRYYTAPTNLTALQHELAFLPAWYASDRTDIVLLRNNTDGAYYRFLAENLSNLAKPVVKKNLAKFYNQEVILWGISPQAIHAVQQINDEYRLNLRLPIWQDEYTYLNSRDAAKDCLEVIIEQQPSISKSIVPCFVDQLDEIEQRVADSPHRLLAKAPYSSSGRGLLWLPSEGLTRTERQILHGMLKKQGKVSIEQVLYKQIDFAMEFMSDGNGDVTFAGYSLFYTNSKGAYMGNFIGSQEKIEEHLSKKIELSALLETQQQVRNVLATKYGSVYKGCIGVDMMIYKEDEQYLLHPCLEINMRYNMGYLAIQLAQKHVSSQSEGRFYIDFSAKENETYNMHCQMQEQYPPLFHQGKLKHGYLALCPVNPTSRYRAYLLIE